MELKDFKGIYLLDAVDRLTDKINIYGNKFEDCEVLRFRLNNMVYAAVQDPDDGYRSCLCSVMELGASEPMANVFPAVEVIARMSAESYIDCMELIDANNGGVVLRIGTNDKDGFYPNFVAEFFPENMTINLEIKKRQVPPLRGRKLSL